MECAEHSALPSEKDYLLLRYMDKAFYLCVLQVMEEQQQQNKGKSEPEHSSDNEKNTRENKE